MAATAQMLVYLPDSAKGAVVQEYAQYLRGLLGGRICYEPMLSKEDVARIGQASTNCDLIVFGELELPSRQHHSCWRDGRAGQLKLFS